MDRWALYGGQDPREALSYATWEAARYLRMPLRTVQNWTSGFHYRDRAGHVRRAKPLVTMADLQRHQLSFLNIAELHVLDSLRWFHTVPSVKLRRLIEYLGDTFDTPHPLVNERMFAGDQNVFIERAEALIEATKSGQIAFRAVALWHFGTLEPWNLGTLEPWNLGTLEPWNLEP